MTDMSLPNKPTNIECALERGVILLHLGEGVFGLGTKVVTIAGMELRPKRELHITIMSGQVGRAIADLVESSPAVGTALRESTAKWDWRFYRTGQRFLVRKVKAGRNVSSVVELVSMPGIEPFYLELSTLVRTPMFPPPVHVTLYTRGDDRGIGLPSRDDLERFGRPLRPGESPQ